MLKCEWERGRKSDAGSFWLVIGIRLTLLKIISEKENENFRPRGSVFPAEEPQRGPPFRDVRHVGLGESNILKEINNVTGNGLSKIVGEISYPKPENCLHKAICKHHPILQLVQPRWNCA